MAWPRLAYADWLEAHDQAPRARLIRLQCDIANKTREATELFHQHGLEWTAPLRALGASRVEFVRGMPEKISVPIRSFLPNHEAINSLTPIRDLSLGLANDDEVGALAKLDVRGLIRSLTIGLSDDSKFPRDFGINGIRELVQTPWLSSLEELTLHSCKVGQDGATVIADSPHLKNLRKLYLDDPAFHKVVGDGSAEIILSSPNLPNVEDLQLGLRHLAPHWTKMVRQDLQREGPNRSGSDR